MICHVGQRYPNTWLTVITVNGARLMTLKNILESPMAIGLNDGKLVALTDELGDKSELMGVSGLIPGEEVVIIPDDDAFSVATKKERDNAICDLFMGLTDAIRKHGCEVDISNPKAIRVAKKVPPNAELSRAGSAPNETADGSRLE